MILNGLGQVENEMVFECHLHAFGDVAVAVGNAATIGNVAAFHVQPLDCPAQRLLECCGFRFSQYLLPAMEFDIGRP